METSPNSQQLVRLLAEESRRRIVAALVLVDAPLTASDIATSTSLDLRTVVDAADRLITGGLLSETDGQYRLHDETFAQAARTEAPPAAPSDHGDQPTDIARVLDTAFVDGRLVQWPAKKSKRLVVLDYLAQCFEIGKRYSEQEVNDMLRPFNDDVAMTRRYLVDEQYMDRSHGEYWRCGGSV